MKCDCDMHGLNIPLPHAGHSPTCDISFGTGDDPDCTCGWWPESAHEIELAKRDAELTKLRDEHDQLNRDWNALMVLIASTIGTDNEREAAELDEVEEFDPWHALRRHATELARMRPIVEAAIAWSSSGYSISSTCTPDASCERCVLEAAIDAAERGR